MDEKRTLEDMTNGILVALAGTGGFMYACNLSERLGFDVYGMMDEINDYALPAVIGGLVVYTLSSLQERADKVAKKRVDKKSKGLKRAI